MQREQTRTAPQKEAPRLSVKAQVQEIIAVMLAFSNLLIRETAALKKADFKAVDALQADKKLFAKQYEAKISRLADYRAELPNLDPALSTKMRQERLRFNGLLDENMRALDLAQNSTKRLINRILEAACQSVTEQKQTNYSNTGRAMAYKSATLSTSVDRTL
ncbi:MAG: hypothetical protein KGL10_02495 [Alphaproteobacteria bacterium]|nr:hypothetical protein [Alphaproteobacteria bacterium]MDE2336158.1 hypothetical protein [Alphaproteobacteria bacterium]